MNMSGREMNMPHMRTTPRQYYDMMVGYGLCQQRSFPWLLYSVFFATGGRPATLREAREN